MKYFIYLQVRLQDWKPLLKNILKTKTKYVPFLKSKEWEKIGNKLLLI